MEKKILILAYSNLNLGDDLFVKMLCERYPQHNFKFISSNLAEEPFRDIDNLEVVYIKKRINSFLLQLRVARQYDATVHIGGSLFIEPKNHWKTKAFMYKAITSVSNSFFLLGANFGPYKSKSFYKKYKNIFNKLNDVSFRDRKSLNLFSDLSTVRLAPDIVFGLDTKDILAIKTEPYITISVIDLTNRPDLKQYRELYENAIVKLTKALVSKNLKVTLISFCANEGDEIAINRILNNVRSEHVDSYFYRGNIDETLSLLKSSKGIVATRFHSLILAWLFDKPVFPFIYSPKTMNVIKDIGFEGNYLNISDLEKINIQDVINQLMNKPNFNINNEILMSERHFNKLDSFINVEEQ